jgi:hypothetical protein
LDIEQHQADKRNQRADQSGNQASGKPVVVFMANMASCSCLSVARLS